MAIPLLSTVLANLIVPITLERASMSIPIFQIKKLRLQDTTESAKVTELEYCYDWSTIYPLHIPPMKHLCPGFIFWPSFLLNDCIKMPLFIRHKSQDLRTYPLFIWIKSRYFQKLTCDLFGPPTTPYWAGKAGFFLPVFKLPLKFHLVTKHFQWLNF